MLGRWATGWLAFPLKPSHKGETASPPPVLVRSHHDERGPSDRSLCESAVYPTVFFPQDFCLENTKVLAVAASTGAARADAAARERRLGTRGERRGALCERRRGLGPDSTAWPPFLKLHIHTSVGIYMPFGLWTFFRDFHRDASREELSNSYF